MNATVKLLAGLCLLSFFACGAYAQYDGDLSATKRLLPAVGPGLRAVRRGADGNLYVLTAPASAVLVFDAAGKLVRKVPPDTDANPAKSSSPDLRTIVFGDDLDVDQQGTVYVADRGANEIKIWDARGNGQAIKVREPVSVAALPDGEVAVATMNNPHLVVVFDKSGQDVREFGDPESISEREDLNRFLSIGTLFTDGAKHLFYAFSYLPEPTVREYDRFGYAGQDFTYENVDAFPEAQAMRKEIARQEQKGQPPLFKRILTAAGVDASSGEVWMALGDKLLHFDKDGNRQATYLLYTPEGARLGVNTVLVDKDHLILGSDPLGIFQFDKPAKKIP